MGTITGWLPPDGDDAAIWHVTHDDGDEEDLDEREVKRCLIDESSSEGEEEDRDGGESKDDTGMQLCAEGDEGVGTASIPRVLSEPKLTRNALKKDAQRLSGSGDLSAEDTGKGTADLLEEFERREPDIARTYLNSFRSGLGMKHFNLGQMGLATEFQRVFAAIHDGLKERNSTFLRSSGRRLWESAVKSAETAVDFRSVLIELEAVVRDTQTVEDTKAEEELENMRAEVRSNLEAEGYVFSVELLGESNAFAEAVQNALTNEDVAVESTTTAAGKKRGRDASTDSLFDAAEQAKESQAKRVCKEESSSGADQAPEGEASVRTPAGPTLIHPLLPLLEIPEGTTLSESFRNSVLADLDGASHIGRKVRRFFRSTDAPSDGVIMAFLPSFLNEGLALWHVMHDDGDEEDIDLNELIKGSRAFENDLSAPEIAGDYDGENGGSDSGSESDQAPEETNGQSDEDRSDGNSEESDASDDEDETDGAKRLWPSAAVRARYSHYYHP